MWGRGQCPPSLVAVSSDDVRWVPGPLSPAVAMRVVGSDVAWCW